MPYFLKRCRDEPALKIIATESTRNTGTLSSGLEVILKRKSNNYIVF